MALDTAGCTACGHTEHRHWDQCRRDGCNCAYRPTETAAWPKPGTLCYFAGCGQPAYALVADVDRAVYVCRECYDRRESER